MTNFFTYLILLNFINVNRNTKNYVRLEKEQNIEDVKQGILVCSDSIQMNGILFSWKSNQIEVSYFKDQKIDIIPWRIYKKTICSMDSLKYLNFDELSMNKYNLNDTESRICHDCKVQPSLLVYKINNGNRTFLYDIYKVQVSSNENYFFYFSYRLLRKSTFKNYHFYYH